MKKLITIAVAVLLLGSSAQAQIVSNGTFDSAAGWTTFQIFGAPGTVTFNYTGARPSASATGGASTGGVLRFQLPAGDTGVGVYTPVTLTGGNTYELDGLARAVSHTAASNWFEGFLTSSEPVAGVDVTATRLAQLNSWACINFDSTFLSCETLTNPGNGGGQFTIPGTGSQTWYLVLKSGTCCGGGAADIVVDTVTLTDLGAGTTYDAPPTSLVESFDDGDDQNNYGGFYRAFAGGDPGGVFTPQDASMTAVSVDAQGFTGAPGDRALHVFASTPLQGQSFIYYGGVLSLSPLENIGQNLGLLSALEFDIKLGNASSTRDWVVRIEDTSGTAPENFTYVDIEPFLVAAGGTNYASVSIPLSEFALANADGGTVAPNLATAKVISLVVQNTALLATTPDIYIDNFTLVGTGGPTYDSPPTPLSENFNDGNDRNNYGGQYAGFAGGDPGGVFTGQDFAMTAASEDSQGTTGVAGDRALHIFANTPLQGQNFIYYGAALALSDTGVVERNLTTFTNLEFDIKLGNASSTKDWVVRIEDTTGTLGENYHYIDIEPLLVASGTGYNSISIPLADLVSTPDGGTVAPDLSRAKNIIITVQDVNALATTPDIYIDNLRLTGSGPTYDSPPTELVEDFDDNDDRNNYGGLYRAFAGGDPGGNFATQDASMTATSVNMEGISGTDGDYAMHFFASTPIQGQSFTYYGGVISLSPGENIGQDLTSFTVLNFDIKLGTASSTKDWVVRLEDTSATLPQNFQYVDLEPLLTAAGTGYNSISIPLADFVSNADGGTTAPNLSAVKVISIVGQDGALLVTDPDIYIDNVALRGAAAASNWQYYE